MSGEVQHKTSVDLKHMRNLCWELTGYWILSTIILGYLVLAFPPMAYFGLFIVVCANVYSWSIAYSAWKEYFDVKSFVKPR